MLMNSELTMNTVITPYCIKNNGTDSTSSHRAVKLPKFSTSNGGLNTAQTGRRLSQIMFILCLHETISEYYSKVRKIIISYHLFIQSIAVCILRIQFCNGYFHLVSHQPHKCKCTEFPVYLPSSYQLESRVHYYPLPHAKLFTPRFSNQPSLAIISARDLQIERSKSYKNSHLLHSSSQKTWMPCRILLRAMYADKTRPAATGVLSNLRQHERGMTSFHRWCSTNEWANIKSNTAHYCQSTKVSGLLCSPPLPL